jgi:hypothetical protein
MLHEAAAMTLILQGNRRVPRRETCSNARARFWFQSVEMMAGTILMNGS